MAKSNSLRIEQVACYLPSEGAGRAVFFGRVGALFLVWFVPQLSTNEWSYLRDGKVLWVIV
jgi:hypothetical protein